jgi:dipeptidyl aminopeptidase/acylaminoacyl peptidase
MNQLNSHGHRELSRLILRYGCLLFALLLAVQVPAAERVPLTPEALVRDVDLFSFESLLPSPDGKWIVFEAGDPSKHMQFDYVGQRSTKSGFPMLASALAFGVWVSEVSTGTSFQLTSEQGSSWNPNWSPDSRYLAFYSDRSGDAALWVWDRETKRARQVSDAPIRSSWWRERPEWSSDGKTVICKILPQGMTREDMLRLSPLYRQHAASEGSAPADGKAPTVHVYSHHPGEAKTNEAKGSTAELEAIDFLDSGYLADLARIDVATGKVTRLAKRLRPMFYAYSPNQTTLSILNVEGMVPNTQQLAYSLKLLNLADLNLRTVVARGFLDANNLTTRVTWSPDGTELAYTDTGKTEERACYIVNVKTGNKRKISSQIPESSSDFSWGPPLWSKNGRFIYLLDSTAGRLWEVSSDGEKTREVVKIPGLAVSDMAVSQAAGTYWSPDGGTTAYIRTHDAVSKKDALYSLQVQTGKIAKLYEGDESISAREMGALIGVTQGSGTLIYSSQSASRPEDVWALQLNQSKPAPLSNLNPQYNSASMGQVKMIEWKSLRGESLRGTLLLPGEYQDGEKYPLVVWIYGGQMGSDYGNRFGFGWGPAFNPQMWASRGYAVLFPDIPLHPGTPVDDLVSAVIPGVNKTVELGIADPERLAVMGQSFGGYNTIAMLTRTTIFKAAIAMSSATTNLFEGYTSFEGGIAPWMGYYEEGQGGMKGTPWEFKERYYDNSPIFFLDRVQTPLLLERGSTDLISRNSGNVFNALRRLNKEVEFLEYDHEEHVVQQPVNVIDFWNRRIDWVSRYLEVKPSAATRPADPHAQ